VRVLVIGALSNVPSSELEYRSVVGGLLVQTRDTALASPTPSRW
jgi:AICAR transformylase/IMP cyclohydrolase PurH